MRLEFYTKNLKDFLATVWNCRVSKHQDPAYPHPILEFSFLNPDGEVFAKLGRFPSNVVTILEGAVHQRINVGFIQTVEQFERETGREITFRIIPDDFGD